jgi:hypothetical protein
MTNSQKRAALLAENKQLLAEMYCKLDSIADNATLSDAECEKLSREVWEDYLAKRDRKWKTAFFLQFPKRRGWFSDTFIPSFGECAGRRLSRKQTDVVARYCVPDDDTWRTGNSYCRAGDKAVTLCIPRYSRGIGYLTVATI